MGKNARFFLKKKKRAEANFLLGLLFKYRLYTNNHITKCEKLKKKSDIMTKENQ